MELTVSLEAGEQPQMAKGSSSIVARARCTQTSKAQLRKAAVLLFFPSVKK